MDFEVTILGSGAAIPTLRRGTTAQYIQCKQRHLLIDCGEGTQTQIRKFGIKYQRISHILISHLHGDHIFGLPGLLSTMQLMGRTQGVTIYGPEGIRNFIRTALDVGKGYFQFQVDFVELSPETSGLLFEDKCIEIHHFPLRHRIPTHGYLIKEKPALRKLVPEKFAATGVSVAYIQKLIQGEDVVDNEGRVVRSDDVTLPPAPVKSYAYCSDTAYNEAVIPHITGADLLYHESTFLSNEADRASETFHSTAAQAATIAQKAKVKKLIMGHFSSRYDDLQLFESEANAIFSPSIAPHDGNIFAI
jgi:ribonuclease Z